MIHDLAYVLSGEIMPVILLGTGLIFSFRLKFFWIFHPISYFRSLSGGFRKSGQSSAKSMTLALAGTLGVGNIAGVASAIACGGAGAVFWMWLSAILAMGVKYAEVVLAVGHRRGKSGGFFGGAMYYIGDLISRKFGAFFALLCIANSLITGNILQVNAASAVYGDRIPPIFVGIIICILTAAVTFGTVKRISDVAVSLIPFLSGVYVILSLGIIIANFSRMPSVLGEIFSLAFSAEGAAGGALGFTVSRGVRYGVTRGILSNEAGCGTAPTAHACADVKSPHHQGLFGIFEVFADTVVICSLTAFVILLYGNVGGNGGVCLSVLAYSSLAGGYAGHIISVSVILFAFATVICQSYYGIVAVGFLSKRESALRLYLILYSLTCIVGSVIDTGIMWLSADLIISLMTAVNTGVLLWVYADRRRRRELFPFSHFS